MSSPNANVFSTNWTDGLNDEQGNIAYCFANIEGYTRSGSYVIFTQDLDQPLC